MNLELLGVPLGIILFYIGSRFLTRISSGLGYVCNTPGRVLLVLIAFSLTITLPTFLLSVCSMDKPYLMLQDTFGAYIADIGLAILMLVLLLNPKCSGMRLEVTVIAMGVIFMTVFGFTGYLTFTESAVLQLLMALVLLVPYLAGKWKDDIRNIKPEIEQYSEPMPPGRIALYWLASFVLFAAGTFAAVYGFVQASYDDYLFSQVVMAFFVGAILAVMQAMPAAVAFQKGIKALSPFLLVACIYCNCIFAIISVYCLPLTSI